MVAFGGSGPAHAIRIARKLRIHRVVVARGAGIFSALGLLVSPLAFEVVRSCAVALADIREGWWQSYIAPLIAEAAAPLNAAGVPPSSIRLRYRLDMRYVGQGHEVEVALPEEAAQLDSAALTALFEARYTALYGHTLPATAVQIVTWKIEAVGPDPLGGRAFHIEGDPARRPARRAKRIAHVDEAGPVDCAVYARALLAPGDLIEGPALIEEPESTCVIGRGDIVRVDAEENLVVDLAPGAATAAAAEAL
jgi:N-methylhydantoinase A